MRGMLFLLRSVPSQHPLRVKDVFPSQGSMDDEISLGAYVAAALLEMGLPLQVSTLSSLLLPPALLGTTTGTHQLVILQATNWEGTSGNEPMFGQMMKSFLARASVVKLAWCTRAWW